MLSFALLISLCDCTVHIYCIRYGIDEAGLARVSVGTWTLPDDSLRVEERCVYDQQTRTFRGDAQVAMSWEMLWGTCHNASDAADAAGATT